ncbi:MAG TPA: 23S rRNA (adenine(2503)-C(2))-methyltransferase RlmN [Candidatus Eisenbacteria bacterium]|nr:23S rRNA (adenine(2503)-C(2))-methyltransferase RlmN [Candidatus Eisenbacteria bacterium]
MPVKSETIIRAQNGTPENEPGPGRADRRKSGPEEPERLDVLGMTVPALERVALSLDERPFRGRQIAEWIYRRGALGFDGMTNLPSEFRGRLAEEYRVGSLTERDRRETTDRKTRKLAFSLREGGVIESVFMSTPTRFTFCLSSQHGCGFACRFCATGRMGRGRNLTAGEIVEQTLRLRRELPKGATDFNIVMMGMGEPLENYENVMTGLGLLTDPSLGAVPPKRITISTVGLVPQIIRMADAGVRYRLAISLHAATDEQRTKLMPINRTFPLEQLMRAVRHHVEKTGRRVTFEYILIEELNDTIGDAAKLVRLVAQLPCKINLIPYNPIGPGKFKRPSPDRIERFAEHLRPRVPAVTVRYSQGVDIGAACGQLAGESQSDGPRR